MDPADTFDQCCAALKDLRRSDDVSVDEILPLLGTFVSEVRRISRAVAVMLGLRAAEREWLVSISPAVVLQALDSFNPAEASAASFVYRTLKLYAATLSRQRGRCYTCVVARRRRSRRGDGTSGVMFLSVLPISLGTALGPP